MTKIKVAKKKLNKGMIKIKVVKKKKLKIDIKKSRLTERNFLKFNKGVTKIELV